MVEAQEIILGEYDLDVHGTPVHIKVYVSTGFVPIYEVTFPGIGAATKFLLLSLRNELVTMVPIDPLRIETKTYMDELNKKYVEASNVLIDKYLPNPGVETKKLLTSYIVNIMLGLGELEVPLADDGLEEIAVNGAYTPIWVFHKAFGWCETTIKLQSEDVIYESAEQIGRRVGREINNLSPLMDAELADGSRVNATLFPISQFGNTITIRKFAKNPWTMPALIKNKTVSPEIAALIWLCVQNELSILISGGTASGKTSFLNAMSIFFPATRRIITVEETRELTLPASLQWVPMITRQPNPEGKGEVTMYNLMVNALRQRPDIMIVGEVRTEKDAETLFEAIHTGHAVYSTVHADNAQDTIIRMSNPPINLPKLMLNSISAIPVLFRHRGKGIRRVLEFGEVLTNGDVNVLHRWDVYSDTFSQIGDMTRLGEMLSLYAGLTKKEIEQDIAEKVKILTYMVDNDIIGIDDSGFVVANYYKNRSKVVEIAEKNIRFSRDIF
jgi:flagellar protein FlaI